MIKTQTKPNAIELKYLAEPLEDAHGTPVEKHCYRYFVKYENFLNKLIYSN
jgi:hypothetical protein